MRSRREALLLALLAIQFGAQPFLRRSCSASVPPVSMVLATDVTKCMLSFAALCFQGLRQSMAGWTLRNSLAVAMVPSVLYVAQNNLCQYAQLHLDALFFNLLNQTKTLAAAACLYLVMGYRQTPLQMIALLSQSYRSAIMA